MLHLILFATGLIIGLVAGLLIYRKHLEKIKATEAKAKSIVDALKGR